MTIPILITWDVDPDLWLPLERRRWALQTAMQLCHEQQIRATFYVTAQASAIYRQDWATLQAQGHEVGCHGWTHGVEENYDNMSAAQQALYLHMATEYLETMSGVKLQAFRSPRVKTSGTTQRLLSELGYLSDSTVCSQRMDLISSNLVNTGWLTAPRLPYHPHPNNAYKKGNLPLWQIPVSAAGLPFISSTMQVVGLPPMQTMFRLLYAEAKRTGKPIVYLAHPVEFVPSLKKKKQGVNWRAQLKPQFFTPTYIRAHGLRLRMLLYRTAPSDLLSYTQQLLAYMASFPDVEFMTMTEYVRKLA